MAAQRVAVNRRPNMIEMFITAIVCIICFALGFLTCKVVDD
jgi:hypothetical protein